MNLSARINSHIIFLMTIKRYTFIRKSISNAYKIVVCLIVLRLARNQIQNLNRKAFLLCQTATQSPRHCLTSTYGQCNVKQFRENNCLSIEHIYSQFVFSQNKIFPFFIRRNFHVCICLFFLLLTRKNLQFWIKPLLPLLTGKYCTK